MSASSLLCHTLWFASQPSYTGGGLPSTFAEKLWRVSSATLAAVVTAVVGTSMPTLEGGRVFASKDATAMVTAARSVADGGIDIDDPAAATRSDDAASSMLEKGKGNKNGSEYIGRRNTWYYNLVWAIA